MSNFPTQTQTQPQRPSWEEYFAQIAQVAATRSPCHRLHVGCVLVRDNRIVSQGYNGFLPGCEHESIVRDGHEQATVHAEQNAVADCARRGVASAGCTAYITHYPCIICTRLLLAAGITEIRYIEEYRKDPLVAHFCERLGVSITKVADK